jgi:hypothetical protein
VPQGRRRFLWRGEEAFEVIVDGVVGEGAVLIPNDKDGLAHDAESEVVASFPDLFLAGIAGDGRGAHGMASREGI